MIHYLKIWKSLFWPKKKELACRGLSEVLSTISPPNPPFRTKYGSKWKIGFLLKSRKWLGFYLSKCRFQEMYENIQKTHVFEGLGVQVGATWGPKSQPKGVRMPKMSREGTNLKVKIEKVCWSSRSCCQSYGNCRGGSETQVRAEVKAYLSDKSYD